jgi:pyruvate carboxylase
VDKADAKQIGAPLHGSLSSVLVKTGQEVKKNDPLFIIEAMKMETEVRSQHAGVVQNISVREGDAVAVGDQLVALA